MQRRPDPRKSSAEAPAATGPNPGASDTFASSSGARPHGKSACSHCGLPAPAPQESGEPTFCCSGCAAVYSAIHDSGMADFYDLPWTAQNAEPGRPTGHGYSEFREPEFLTTFAEETPSGLRRIALYLEGVHCASCVWLVEKLSQAVPGVLEARLHAARHVAHITWDPAKVGLPAIASTLDRWGYPPHPYRAQELDRLSALEDRKHLARIGVAGALAGNVMLFAFALYGGYFSGIATRYENLIKGVSFGLTLIAVFGPGRVFLRGAWNALRARQAHMDLPVAIALLLGTANGGWNTLRGSGEVYFESLTAVIFLLLIGRWLTYRQRKRAGEAVELLFALTPQRTRRWDGTRFVEIPIHALQRGDLVEVPPQSVLPADGCVEEGTSAIDLAHLTGESMPQSVEPGSAVFAGTTNLSERLTLRVQETGTQSRIGALMRLVADGAAARPRWAKAADRWASHFVITVLTLALLTVFLWMRWDPSRAIDQAIALLIVSCPCALGLATPLAFQAAIGQAAQAGIMIKSGDAIERLASHGIWWLDKTGTLTQGRLEVRAWHGDPQVASEVCALERDLPHPIAKALVAYGASQSDLRQVQVDGLRVETGAGVCGTIAGQEWRVGSLTPAAPDEAVPDWLREGIAAANRAGATPVLVSRESQPVALIELSDRLRPEARSTVARLQALGWEPRLITGDQAAAGRAVAAALDIDADKTFAQHTPEQKLERVRASQQESHPQGAAVVMTGDGVNDAAALALADCGVAVSGGAEASLKAADTYLTRPGVQGLVELVEGSRRTMGVVRRCAGFSLAYNGIAVWGAIQGWIHPLIAAAMMPLSSLTVVALAYRSRTFRSTNPAPPAADTAPPRG